jgi:DNA-binding NtrC family response regulator
MSEYSANRHFTILVADRNPHVRDFLRREMMAEGFHVDLARNASEVLKRVYEDESIDLIIIDPDLPDVSQEELLAKLSDLIPGLPIVVHSFSFQYAYCSEEPSQLTFVKKEGESIEALKKIVMEILIGTRQPACDNAAS